MFKRFCQGNSAPDDAPRAASTASGSTLEGRGSKATDSQRRRQRREAQAAEAQAQAGAESRTQGRVARRSRPRAHPDLLTVAIRGHFAERMRALSESTGMSLAKLLKDSLLVYEGQTEVGYEPGTRLRQWQESVAGENEQA